MENTAQVRKALGIIKADRDYGHLIVSAPKGVTDLLKRWHPIAHLTIPESIEIRAQIEDRFHEIVRGFSLPIDMSPQMGSVAARIAKGATIDYAMSRGEHYMALIMSRLLGWGHIEAEGTMIIDAKRRIDFVRTAPLLIAAAGRVGNPFAMGGFYGTAAESREIRTLTRGGSDTTGSWVAKTLKSSRYDNCTDQDGMRMADPGIVPEALQINETSYVLAREFGLRGRAEKFIFHPAATIPVEDAGIPTLIRNTNNPSAAGTLLTKECAPDPERPVLGITGRRECHLIEVHRRGSDDEIGDIHRATGVLLKHGVPVRHVSTGTDSFSLIVYNSDVGDKAEAIEREIRAETEADEVAVMPDAVSVVTVVGGGLKGKPGMLACFSGALAHAGINIVTTDQGASELSFTFSVRPDDYRAAVQALYNEAISLH